MRSLNDWIARLWGPLPMISGDEKAEYDALERTNRLLSEEKKMPEEAPKKAPSPTRDEAIAMSILFAMMAASGRKDPVEFQTAARETFLSFLDGLGYTVVAK